MTQEKNRAGGHAMANVGSQEDAVNCHREVGNM